MEDEGTPTRKEHGSVTETITQNNERYEDKNFVDTSRPVWNYSILYDDDIQTFQAGTNYTLSVTLTSNMLSMENGNGSRIH